ncbi:hypothetical protein WMY93_020238 [Mugilogobius chulae]|uniref:C-type lectin domain-containing protein n=1 Tax=Mugilogobius chulae TaxID=88201 RepID=A0AAW0NGI8_9GOBI
MVVGAFILECSSTNQDAVYSEVRKGTPKAKSICSPEDDDVTYSVVTIATAPQHTGGPPSKTSDSGRSNLTKRFLAIGIIIGVLVLVVIAVAIGVNVSQHRQGGLATYVTTRRTLMYQHFENHWLSSAIIIISCKHDCCKCYGFFTSPTTSRKTTTTTTTTATTTTSTVPPCQTKLHCGTGWEQNRGMCYYFSNDTLSWNESKQRCESLLDAW